MPGATTLLVCDDAVTLRALVGPRAPGTRVRVSALPPPARRLWHTLSDTADVTVLEDAFPDTGFGLVAAVGSAAGSQLDLLQAAGDALDLGEPVACLALEGRGFHGQRGRPWVALPGNLHLSVAWRAAYPAHTHGVALAMLPALSTAEAVRRVTDGTIDPRIKWVNDVLVDERKVAGVLTTTHVAGGTIEQVAIGVGLNVARTPDLVLTPFVPGATSLADAVPGLGLTLADVVPVVLRTLDARRRTLVEEGPEALFAAYRELSLVIGRRVRVYPEGLDDTRPLSMWPPPFAEGVVTALGSDLALHLEGRAAPVRTGRLVLEP